MENGGKKGYNRIEIFMRPKRISIVALRNKRPFF